MPSYFFPFQNEMYFFCYMICILPSIQVFCFFRSSVPLKPKFTATVLVPSYNSQINIRFRYFSLQISYNSRHVALIPWTQYHTSNLTDLEKPTSIRSKFVPVTLTLLVSNLSWYRHTYRIMYHVPTYRLIGHVHNTRFVEFVEVSGYFESHLLYAVLRWWTHPTFTKLRMHEKQPPKNEVNRFMVSRNILSLKTSPSNMNRLSCGASDVEWSHLWIGVVLALPLMLLLSIYCCFFPAFLALVLLHSAS